MWQCWVFLMVFVICLFQIWLCINFFFLIELNYFCSVIFQELYMYCNFLSFFLWQCSCGYRLSKCFYQDFLVVFVFDFFGVIGLLKQFCCVGGNIFSMVGIFMLLGYFVIIILLVLGLKCVIFRLLGNLCDKDLGFCNC